MEFRNKNLLDCLGTILKETALESRYLELEVTESVLMQDVASAAGVLRAIKAMGLQLAMDAFGTGYSSLSCLKRFPIDALKLDRSFICDLTPSDDCAIVRAVISMGNSLNHRVIAEGVETREQLAFLQGQHCGEGQGFYFSPPVVPDKFVQLLTTGLSAAVLN